MDVALSEEQQELASMVRSLLDKRGDARAETYDEALWQTMVEQIGLPALGIPEEYGGAGFTLFEALVALEEVGRALVPSPLLSSLVTSEALLAGADDDAKARLLPRLAAGEVGAFVDGDGPVLDGDLATVVVVVDGDGLFELADADTTWTPTMDQTIRLATVAGGTRTRIGDAGPARDRARQVGAVGCAALAGGLAALALVMTVSLSKERVQFGRPIGSFQALKHRMADMLVLTEMCRSASWAASYAVALGSPEADRLAHVASAYCSDAVAHLAAETVQLHGGIAITWEHDAHLVFKRAHALGQLFGSAREHRAALPL